jgi:hypothetical protein
LACSDSAKRRIASSDFTRRLADHARTATRALPANRQQPGVGRTFAMADAGLAVHGHAASTLAAAIELAGQ